MFFKTFLLDNMKVYKSKTLNTLVEINVKFIISLTKVSNAAVV